MIIPCGVHVLASLYCNNKDNYIKYSVNLKMYAAYVTAFPLRFGVLLHPAIGFLQYLWTVKLPQW
jgi:hypothetical protein